MDYGVDDHEIFDDQPTGFARWILPALIISVLLHVLLFMWVRTLPLHYFSDIRPVPPQPPAIFKLARVPIDPEVFKPVKADEKKAAASPRAVQLPKDQVSFESMMSEVKSSPAAPKIENPMLAEKPKVDATSYQQTVGLAERSGIRTVSKEMEQFRQDLITDKPDIAGRPLLEMAPQDKDAGGSPGREGPIAGGSTPGFSNLDDLLAQTGPLTDETAPIKMDSDVLYEYDSYQLQASAVESLQKLGLLIQRNPQLDFSIEGHSDSHGPDDYNLQLSLARAESVKNWLVQNMGIDPSRIRTKGFGKTQLRVPPSEDIAKESENRRVEIVLHDRPQP